MIADRTSGDFGGRLREARERRGISLRQIANATKIAVSVLEALERNDISRLPGGIFGRAFVRSYAIEVGLDPETTIQEFIAQFPNDSVTVGHPTSGKVEDHQAVESDRRMAGTFLWLFLISVPIAGAVLYFATAGRLDAPAEPPDAAVTAPEPETKPVTDAPLPPPEPARIELPPPPESAPPAATPPAGDHLTVAITVKSPCFVSATLDGQKIIERLMQPGEQRTLEVTREMVITAGDGAALALTLNGANARPLGKPGEVVTARFNLANFKTYVQAR